MKTDYQPFLPSGQQGNSVLSEHILSEEELRRLQVFAYSYLHKRLCISEDLATSYYLQICDDIPAMVRTYQPGRGASIEGWLIVKLRYRFYDFISRRKRQDHPLAEVSYDALIEPEFESVAPPEQSNLRRLPLNRIISRLKPDVQLAARLYYGFPLRLSDLRILRKKLGRDKFSGSMRSYRKKLNDYSEAISKWRDQIDVRLAKLDSRGIISGKEDFSSRHKRILYEEAGNPPLPFRFHEIGSLLNETISSVHRKIRSCQKHVYFHVTRSAWMSHTLRGRIEANDDPFRYIARARKSIRIWKDADGA